MTTTWVVLTLAVPWLGALGVWLMGDKRPRAVHVAASVAAVAGALAAVGLAIGGISNTSIQFPAALFLGELRLLPDGLGVLLTLIAAVVGSLTVVFSTDYMHGERSLARYYALVLLFIGAMEGLVLSDSLLMLFIFWEITALCSYALISFYNDDPRAVAAGLKALIITQIGGVGLLVGALIVFGSLGSYSISGFLAQTQHLSPALLSGLAFGFLLAAMAKSAQVPFHGWLPDAMEAPTPVSALIHAATMVNAGVYLLARFYPAFAPVPGWTTAVIGVGVLSALLAGLMALVATDLKRVLAYSTISQLGYMVYAVGTGAIFASQFHLLSHAVFKALLFLGAGAIIHAVGTRDLRAMGGLGKTMPFVRNTFVIGALALAGIPFLNGFWSKELLLDTGLKQGPAWAYVAMLAGGGLTALYVARVVWLVFFGAARDGRPGSEAPRAMRVALGVLAGLTLTTWLASGPLSQTLAATLPWHQVSELPLGQLLADLLTAPATYVALTMTAAGLAAWWGRERLQPLTRGLQPLGRMASAGFGFGWIERRLARLVQSAARVLTLTQTGQLNWNVAGVVGGLVLILALVAWRH